MSKKAMVSQPMAGKSDMEVFEEHVRAIKVLEKQGYQIVNTFFAGEWLKKENLEAAGIANVPLLFMSKSLEGMSKCDAVYFCKGWQSARGCLLEHAAATAYGLEVIEEEQQ